jgi:hypothetical protein
VLKHVDRQLRSRRPPGPGRLVPRRGPDSLPLPLAR